MSCQWTVIKKRVVNPSWHVKARTDSWIVEGNTTAPNEKEALRNVVFRIVLGHQRGNRLIARRVLAQVIASKSFTVTAI